MGGERGRPAPGAGRDGTVARLVPVAVDGVVGLTKDRAFDAHLLARGTLWRATGDRTHSPSSSVNFFAIFSYSSLRLVVLVSDRGAFLCQFNYALLKDLTVFLSSRLVGVPTHFSTPGPGPI